MHTFKRNRWSVSEDEYIKKVYRTILVPDIAKKLNRSEKATRSRIERLDIKLSNLERNKPKPKPIRRKYKGYHFDQFGRKQISIGKGKFMAEHRVLVAKRMGRKLLRTEQVHHIDCDKRNNELGNLFLFENASKHLNAHRLLEKLVKELMGRNIIKFNPNQGRYEICKNQ